MLTARPFASAPTVHRLAQLPLILALLLTLLPSMATMQLPTALAGPTHQAAAPAASLTERELSSVQALIRTAEYQPTALASATGQPSFWAPNRANRLDLTFGPDGLQIVPDAEQPAWSLRMGLRGYGYASAVQSLNGIPTLTAEGWQVVYGWPGISEWYVNNEQGLKHNLTLQAPPSGPSGQLLQFDLALAGDLRLAVAADGSTLSLYDPQGNEALGFGALYAYDASGRTLPAHYGQPVASNTGSLLPILVDARGAVYPITVDPLITARAAKLSATIPGEGAFFGNGLAISNDLLAVGVPRESTGANTFDGAVYLFARNQGGAADSWSLLRRIALTTPVNAGQLGYSVDIFGDTLVVGSPGENGFIGAAYIFARNQGGPDNWGRVQRLFTGAGLPNDQYGISVTISGDTVVVGASDTDQSGNESGAAYIYSRNAGGPDNWGLIKQVTASDASAGAQFGTSLALDSDTLAVGASNAANQGAVYIYRRNKGPTATDVADNWGQVKKVVAADPAADDNFGRDVSISADTLVVGAPLEDTAPNADNGAAYIFARNQPGLIDNWGQVQKLVAPDAAVANLFGAGVAISGDTVVVGSPGGGGTLNGVAYIYLRNQLGADQWGFNSLLNASDAAGGGFGTQVAIDGLFVAASAPLDTVGGQAQAGSAYAFVRSGPTWSEIVRRIDNEAGEQDNFGYSVAISGDTLVVGAAGDDLTANDMTNRGAAYIFRRNQGGTPDSWALLKKLAQPAPAVGDDFGYSVAINGDTIVVGARRDNTAAPLTILTDVGSAYVYQRNQGGLDNWGLVQTLNGPGFAAGDIFGYAVVIDGDIVAVGAPRRDDGTSNQGRVYIYARNQGGVNFWGLVTPTGITGSDSAAVDGFGSVLALAGDTLVVGVPGDNGVAIDTGTAFVFARNQGGVDAWGQVVRLAAPPGEQSLNDYFGSSVAIDSDIIAVGAQGEATTGAVYLFARNQGGPNSWGPASPVSKITPTAGPGNTALTFGGALALDNDTLVVGARGSTTAAGAAAGTAYIFYRNQGGVDSWGQARELTGSNPLANDQFGLSVAATAGLAIVGAPFGSTPPTPVNGLATDTASADPNREAVFIFSLNDTSTPTITNVTSSTPNGSYATGSSISIQVTFSEPVFVVGTPTLTLETGTTDRDATYSSGSGTGTLTFSYTVVAGDSSLDLDYLSPTALALSVGGFIRDLAGNNATLTLAAPGAIGSLGANKAIVIDAIVPTVTGVTATNADGLYGIGNTIDVVVSFSEAVNVTGTPTLSLETGATDVLVSYSSGSGSTTLTFTYTVVEGNVSLDLDYINAAALSLNSGTINDVNGNPATLTLPTPGTAGSLGANKAIVIDGVRPTVTIQAVTPDPRNTSVASIDLTFSEVVVNVTLSDLSLTLNGVAVDLSTATLTAGPTTYTLGNLAGLTSQVGTYVLSVSGSSDIADGAGNLLTTGASESWSLTAVGTTTTVTSAPNPSVFGQAVTITATVTSGAGMPSGNVTFFADGLSIGTATLNGSGEATITIDSLIVGSTAISASYEGVLIAPAFAASAATSINQVVNQASTSLTHDAAPTTAAYGQPVTLTATIGVVAPGAGTPSGAVVFSLAGVPLGTVAIDASGTATLVLNDLPVGVNTILATYNGDTNFSASSDTATVTVSQGTVTVGLTSQPNPSGVGQAVVFTATVSPVAPSLLAPTGTVEFFNGVTSLGTVAVDANGVATITVANLPTGSNVITADYSGDAGYGGLTSAGYTQVVDARIAALTLASLPNPSVFGQSVTITATISAGNGTPSGTITFFNGGTSLGTLPLNSGEAVLTTASLPVGTNVITASYSGDAAFNPTSAVLSGGQVVNKANTTTLLSSAPNPAVRGQGVILTATVGAVAPGAGTPTGTVEFFGSGGVSLGIVPIGANGVAVITFSSLPVGTSALSAVYSGSGNFNTSTSAAVSQVVNKANTSLTLSSSPNPSNEGATVLLTAQVAVSTPGAGTPTGTVEFKAGSTSLGIVAVSGGVATLSVTTLPVGTNLLTAIYSGDASFTSSVSNGINQVVVAVVAPTPSTLYLPMVFQNYVPPQLPQPQLPDLVVQQIRTQNGMLEVVIANVGAGSVNEPFWVDLYIQPTTAPTGPNQTWDAVGSRGLVWGVNTFGLPLNPGDSLVLTVDDEFYRVDLSNPGGAITLGDTLYAQVDSADTTRSTGGVFELDEELGGVYNNITSTLASSTIPLSSVVSRAQFSATADLPRR